MKLFNVKSLRIALSAILVIYTLVQVYNLLKFTTFPDTYRRCGEITFKSSYDQKHKHSTSVEFVLVIRYDDTGRKEDEDVSASTWSSYNVGDTICFIEQVKPPNSIIGFFNFMVGMVAGFVIVVVICVFIFYYCIRWVFTGKPVTDMYDDFRRNEGNFL